MEEGSLSDKLFRKVSTVAMMLFFNFFVTAM
jgi:hypothetical protein